MRETVCGILLCILHRDQWKIHFGLRGPKSGFSLLDYKYEIKHSAPNQSDIPTTGSIKVRRPSQD